MSCLWRKGYNCSSTLVAAPTLLVDGISPPDWCCWDDPAPCPGQAGGVSPPLCTEGYRTGREIIKSWIKPDLSLSAVNCTWKPSSSALKPLPAASSGLGRDREVLPNHHPHAGQKTTQHHSPQENLAKNTEQKIELFPRWWAAEFHKSQNWFRKGNERPSMSQAQGWPLSHKVSEGVKCHNPLPRILFKPQFQWSLKTISLNVFMHIKVCLTTLVG